MKALFTLLALILPAAAIGAATLVVPDTYPTIQSAIGCAVNGDTILVRPGLYVENIDFRGKAITVRSEAGPTLTTIDGGSPLNPDFGCVVIFQGGEGPGSVLDGFTITNGTGKLVNTFRIGGGIYCDDNTGPTIINNIIAGNDTALDAAGGIYCSEFTTPVIRFNTISNNSAESGGALATGSGTVPVIEDNVISDNYGKTRGGALSLWKADALISRNTFLNNTWPGQGGAIYCENCSPLIEDNHFEGNKASSRGAAINCITQSSPTIRRNTFVDNYCTGAAGAIYCYDRCNPVIDRNIITRNSAASAGGIYFSTGSSARITNTVIAFNTARDHDGGAFACWDCDPYIINSTIVGNVAKKEGGAVCCNGRNRLTIVNTILWENKAPAGPEIAVGWPTNPSTVSISHSILQGGPALVQLDALCRIDVGPGVIDQPPFPDDQSSDDLHIRWDSPCRNAGDDLAAGSLALDFEGDRRIHNWTVDIGADEFHPHLYLTGDPVPGGAVEINIVGIPGSRAFLAAANGIADPPVQTPWGVLYLQTPIAMSWFFRALPPKGILSLPMTVPAGWSPGSVHPFQAIVDPLPQLTNLLELTVE